jgi:hypothetical protein
MTPQLRQRDRIQDGGEDGWGKDADRKTGGPRYPLSRNRLKQSIPIVLQGANGHI